MPETPSELRVFISSTFRDMQEEREHLVKKIFPEIRALCRERGVTFTEVDLRWGLTEENQVLGQIIRTCMEEIDRCRPYFIGITGDRYGYIPALYEIHKDGELLQRYPWIEDAAMEEASIIDMEFRHAVLNGRREDVGNDGEKPMRAFFYFRRKRRGLEEEGADSEQARLEELKERVRNAGLPVEEFREPVTLGEMIYDELLEILKTDFANVRPPSPLDAERSKHEAFAASRRRAYIPNVAYLKRLNEFVATPDHERTPLPLYGSPEELAAARRREEGIPSNVLILYAESGSGKSSLIAYWADTWRRKQPEHPLVEHYVGIGAGATDHYGIMRHIMEEIRERFNREEEIPSTPEELERSFPTWLGFTMGAPITIIIDGINQLQGPALTLSWLPRYIPKNIRLIISSTVEHTLVQLRERGWDQLGMQPLAEKEREAIIVRFLSDYRKALSPDQVRRIAADQKCAHPLFLRTLLEELRVFGQHERLVREIDRHLDTTGTEDLFQVVLERIEEDFGARIVREVMSLIWASRNGLTEIELQELTGTSRLKLNSMLLSLDFHLVRREGLFTFFHDYLRRAVEKRYLFNEGARRNRHLELADYFEKLVNAEIEAEQRAGREFGHSLS